MAPALGPWALCGRRRQSPAERLAKSPGRIRVGRATWRCGAACGVIRSVRSLQERRASAVRGSARSRPACRRSRAARPARPSDVPGAHEDAALGQPAHDVGLVALLAGRSNQTKFACDSARLDAELAQPVLEPHALGEVALDALGDLVRVLAAPRAPRPARRRCRRTAGAPGRRPCGSSPTRTARSRPAARTARRSSRTSAAARGSGACRAARPTRPGREHVELAVGLVEDHGDVARDLARRRRRSRRAAAPSTSGCSGCRRSRAAWRP